jgi:hypothetical protein
MGVPTGAAAFLAACLLRGASGLRLHHAPERLEHQMTDHRCLLMCQRHAMATLGASFAKIGSPAECMAKCDQIYTTKPNQYGGVLNITAAVDKTLPAAALHAGLQVAGVHSTAADSAHNSSATMTFVLSANASVNTTAWQAKAEAELNEGLTPHMSQAEQRLFKRYLTSATNYFEFGSGGSTEWAAKAKNLKHIHTVESDAGWISTLRKRSAVHQAEKDGRLQLEHVDIGPTGSWGRPIGRGSVSLCHKYSDRINKASEGQWDVIFIDGRFRVSCFLKGLLRAPDATLIIHDYKNREEYHVVERFARKVASADSLYVFQRKEEADMQRLKWWAEHSETDPA